ncbi:MAG: type VI secretion system accessory protein TagJ, partial [Planctomycetota bacterium]
VALLVEALRLTAGERHDEARELRDRAFEEAPASTGTIDQQPFEWIADADSRLGPILEAIVNGRYHWIPFDRIRRIQLERPADLRDSVWMPVHFTWANGGDAVGLVPSRYPGSERSVDNLIQSARKTEWIESGDAFLGLGQRMLTTDQGEHPLLDIRSIVLDARAVEPAFADGEGSGQSGQQEQRDGGDGAGGVMDASHGGG